MTTKSPQLFAPESYWNATPTERSAVCNGCGTAGWKGKLVPDSMWGLNITKVCNIHDWMYHYGKTETERCEADRVFLNNLIRIINAEGGWLASLRRYRATTYYNSVHNYGGPAFWDNKNPDGTMKT